MLVVAFAAYTQVRDYLSDRQLLTENPDRIPSEPALASYANGIGKAAFETNCVSCHGGDMRGNQRRGRANLTDNIWLFDFGRVSDIERTILYGIRAGLGKSHNVTDMPAIGLQKALSPDEIKDVIAYTLSLSKHQEEFRRRPTRCQALPGQGRLLRLPFARCDRDLRLRRAQPDRQ